jgi:Glycosyl transferase family 2
MNTCFPSVSIVIPAFNRIAPLRATLLSASRSADRLGEPMEILLVDDGSEPPLATALGVEIDSHRVRIIRQVNQGSIVARQTGLHEARGEFVLFLDSDDLIAPEKLRQHIARLRAEVADICYDDLGEPQHGADAPESTRTQTRLVSVRTVEELMLRVQPAPHGPIYRRDYLNGALAKPLLPPLRQCDSVGDIWLYYNLCIFPARIAKIDAPLTLLGEHEEARYSHHWERLGFASLGVMESFMQRCPVTPATDAARMLVGECAFNSWRRLPRGFVPEFSRRLLAIWREAPAHDRMRLGGPLFRTLALLFGRVVAGRLLRLRNASYASIRTLDDTELARLRRT